MTKRDHGVKARVYTYLTRHPGVVFTTAELRRELDIRSSGTIGSALLRLRDEGHNIQTPTRGSWVYRGGEAPALPLAVPAAQVPPAPPGKIPLRADQLQIIATADDLIVARDGAGRIWVMRTITRERQAA